MESALSRIERALARLEQAGPSPVSDDTDLAKRHEALRGKVAKTLAELDAVIASAAE